MTLLAKWPLGGHQQGSLVGIITMVITVATFQSHQLWLKDYVCVRLCEYVGIAWQWWLFCWCRFLQCLVSAHLVLSVSVKSHMSKPWCPASPVLTLSCLSIPLYLSVTHSTMPPLLLLLFVLLSLSPAVFAFILCTSWKKNKRQYNHSDHV